ncbi:MAG: patatin-like phospholipase family protein [Myxococcota bacterium]
MAERPRRLLYVGPLEGADPLGISRAAATERLPSGALRYQAPDGVREIHLAQHVDAAHELLQRHAVDALLLETRTRPPFTAGENPTRRWEDAAGKLLERLFPEGEVHAGTQRGRVVAIVGPDARGAQSAYRLGALGVGSVLCAPTWEQLHGRIDELLAQRVGGKIAVCLAGGGIEGLLYELGVLRALDSFLVNRRLEDLDLFCGISAGAVLGAFLANGVSPAEIGHAFAGGSSRVAPIRRQDLFDPNIAELSARLGRLGAELARGGVGPRGALSSLTRAVPTGAFAGAALRRYLKRHLTQPGLSDRFSELRRPLFVGATDQDTSTPVVFSAETHNHVPIHRAVRASAALAPFYAPEEIDGRWYIDGAFTRTTNMTVAVEQGATMVIMVDPLVPVRGSAGYVRSRGGIFSSMQGLKALVNGRFGRNVRRLRERYPDVSFYLFRPHGDEMRILAGSPMKYFWRGEVEDLAYENSLAKIRAAFGDLRRDFARHGVVFRDPAGQPATRPVDGSRELCL